MPLVAVREWLTGIRPVAGALGACGLMLLACSWFAFNPGGVDVGQNADAPTAVRINDALNETLGESHALRESVRMTPTQRTSVGRAHFRQAPAKATSTRTSATEGPRSPDASPAPATQTATPHAATQPTTPSSPATTPTDDPGVTITTPTLPPPLDGVPTVTTPTVPVPQVPSLPTPDLPTITTKLGLP